ncbi:MAG TPA: nucleotidyl transferase AbiEii/AbiGii toxin family protein [Puia sp.]|nr:nucleotidyl transferase AbiEii/AbiGii toxin family protein [Puia sp.]
MNWSNIREGELKELLNALQEAFTALGIDYYMIGAVAREIWFSRGDKKFRRTNDVDFAAFVGNQEQYAAIRQYLKEKKGFQETKTNSFVLITPNGMQVDILPFGGIEMDGTVKVEGIGLTNINVNGLMEVYTAGTEPVTLDTGHQFQVASLPSIVLLKLIAFDDRPEVRQKDVRDIGNLIANYFELQADLIYEQHVDLFSVDDDAFREQSLQELAAIVIGREIKKIIQQNSGLLQRVKSIVENFLAQKEESVFVRQVVQETNQPVSEILKWLTKLLGGLQGST